MTAKERDVLIEVSDRLGKLESAVLGNGTIGLNDRVSENTRAIAKNTERMSTYVETRERTCPVVPDLRGVIERLKTVENRLWGLILGMIALGGGVLTELVLTLARIK